ncbi:HPr kinase/phosphorylase [Tsuneonella mangrovi]|uniref:HPr kinase/phosphorylase n=1 Tax=Tsuneonella mangrovi TaxID=1982042 RepID=UPI000BA26E11|nr:HPr kinase/phosphatase C-terminal domain-containing protein [Tsuneonella mangrovi]
MSTPILHQATGVAIDGRVLLIEGPPGAGKSSLALALIDRGAKLVGDDGVALSRDGAALIASPPQNTAGLIELRNVGIVTLPATSGQVSLVLDLTEDAPRYVEQADLVDRAGLAIPCLAFDPRGPASAARAEYALALHGLPLSIRA